MRDLLRINGEVIEVTAAAPGDGTAKVRLDGMDYSVSGLKREGDTLEFVYEGQRYSFLVRTNRDLAQVTDGRSYYAFHRVVEGAEEEESGGELTSQMPGTVLKIMVEPGTKVGKGTPLLILEAMKMEHEVCAPGDGTVTGYPHGEGERVMPGDLLVEFEG